MVGIDWIELSRGVPGLSALVIFIFLMLKVLERQDKRDDKRDATFVKAIEDQRKAWQDAVKESDAEWRTAISNFQTATMKSIDVLVTEMRTLNALTASTNQLVTQHDMTERELWNSNRSFFTGLLEEIKHR